MSKYSEMMGVDWSDSGCSQVIGYFEHGKEPSVSIKLTSFTG